MPARSLNTKVNMDVSGYKKEIGEITQRTKNIRKELELWSVQNQSASNSSSYLAQKLKAQKQEYQQLSRQIEITRSKLVEQSQKFGESSTQAERLKGKLLDLQIQQGRLNNEIKKSGTPLTNMIKNISTLSSNIGSKLQGIGSTMTYATTLPLVALGAGMVKLSMDASESENLFAEAMDDYAEDARKWSQSLRDSLKLNDYELRKNAGLYHILGTSMQIPADMAITMSKRTTELAYDLASLYNVSNSQALDDLRAIWNGQTEPLEKYGISIKERTIEQWALRNSLIKQGEQLTEQQKIFARYNLVLESTTKAQGDLARTLDSPTNKLRVLQERVTLLGIELGQKLLPLVERGLEIGNKVLDWFEGLGSEGQEAILILGGIVAASGPVITALGGIAIGIGAIITPTGLVIAAIATLTAGLAYLYTTNEDFRNSVNDTWNNIMMTIQTAQETISVILDKLGIDFGSLAEKINSTVTRELEILLTRINLVTTGIRNILEGNWKEGIGKFSIASNKETSELYSKIDKIVNDRRHGGAGGSFATPEKESPTSNINTDNLAEYFKRLDDSLGKLGDTGSSAYEKLTDAAQDYTDAIKRQTDSFAGFGNMFDKVMFERFSPAKIQSRLNRFLQQIQQWQSNLMNLEKRGVGSEIIGSLRSMGLSGSGIVAGLGQMNDSELVSTINTIGHIRGVASQEASKAVAYSHKHSGTIEVKGVSNSGELVSTVEYIFGNYENSLKAQDSISVSGNERRGGQ